MLSHDVSNYSEVLLQEVLPRRVSLSRLLAEYSFKSAGLLLDADFASSGWLD